MAAKVRGTVHLYGITGTVSNATVQSVKIKSATQNNDTTVDENGNEIESRMDDIVDEGTVEIKMRAAYAIPASGDTLVYETFSYAVLSLDRAEQAKGFRILTITIKKTEYVDAGTVTSVTTTGS